MKLREAGIIRPSRSPWAAGIVLTRKKAGSYRFNVDYRRLNDLTVPDAYPMPRIDEALAAMGGSRYFSGFDMTSGYWQVEMAEEDKPKTAFVTRDGLFEWNRMPFGLRNAPATYCRLMGKVLAGLTHTDCMVYMDDVLVFSESYEGHIEKLDRVFQRFREHGLTVKCKMCNGPTIHGI